jgi:hypothetical protein
MHHIIGKSFLFIQLEQQCKLKVRCDSFTLNDPQICEVEKNIDSEKKRIDDKQYFGGSNIVGAGRTIGVVFIVGAKIELAISDAQNGYGGQEYQSKA